MSEYTPEVLTEPRWGWSYSTTPDGSGPYGLTPPRPASGLTLAEALDERDGDGFFNHRGGAMARESFWFNGQPLDVDFLDVRNALEGDDFMLSAAITKATENQ